MFMARMFCGLNPVSTLLSRITVLASRPAQTSSTRVNAISETTSALRRWLRLADGPEPRPPSFNDSARLGLESCSAGASPNMRPVIIDMAKVNPRQRMST